MTHFEGWFYQKISASICLLQFSPPIHSLQFSPHSCQPITLITFSFSRCCITQSHCSAASHHTPLILLLLMLQFIFFSVETVTSLVTVIVFCVTVVVTKNYLNIRTCVRCYVKIIFPKLEPQGHIIDYEASPSIDNHVLKGELVNELEYLLNFMTENHGQRARSSSKSSVIHFPNIDNLTSHGWAHQRS